MWYQLDATRSVFVKIVPSNVGEMFSSLSLAHWIMEDGYFDSYERTETVLVCNESFTLEECVILQGVLADLGIRATLKVRDSSAGTHRIRISKRSMARVRQLVTLHMHPDFLYKLGSTRSNGPSLNFTVCWNTLKARTPHLFHSR